MWLLRMSIVVISQAFGSYWETLRQKGEKLPIAKGSNTVFKSSFLWVSKGS